MTTKTQDPAANGVKYDALAPVQNTRTLKGLLERQLPAIGAVVPRGVTPERMMRMMLVAVNRQPQLLQCTQESVLETLADAASLGLDIGSTTGEAYAVPFTNTIKVPVPGGKGAKQAIKVQQATLIPGYRGLQKLARQSGEVGRIEAEPVHEHDHFEYQKGTNFKLEFRPKLDGDRGPVKGYYCLICDTDGNPLAADYMTEEQVENVRQMAKSKDSPAWKYHRPEMGRKTVFRRAVKWAPISAEKFQRALEVDNADYDLDVPFEVIDSTATGSKADSLADRLQEEDEPEPEQETTEDEPTPEPDPEKAADGSEPLDAEAQARILKFARDQKVGASMLNKFLRVEFETSALAKIPAAHEKKIVEWIRSKA